MFARFDIGGIEPQSPLEQDRRLIEPALNREYTPQQIVHGGNTRQERDGLAGMNSRFFDVSRTQ
jgi:hypothetical protein